MTAQEQLEDLAENYGETAKRVNNDIRQLGNDVAELLTEATALKGIMATPQQIAGVQSLVDGLNSLVLPEPIVIPDLEAEAGPAPKKPAHAPEKPAPHDTTGPGKR